MDAIKSGRGFSLIETLVATVILITALAGVAQLLILSAQWSRTAAGANGAILAAQEKLEELRGAPFGYDETGEPLTDPALEISPDSSLKEDIDPFDDWLNAANEVTDDPDDVVLSRRWRVSALGDGVPDAVVIEVCVFRSPFDQAETCLSTVRTRQS